MDFINFDFDLQLFDGGAAAGGEGAGTAGMGEGAQADVSTETKTRRSRNPLSQVVYGKQPAGEAESLPDADSPEGDKPAQQPDTQVTANTAEERRAAFENLIKGEYREEFGKRVQQVLDQRFKETSALQSRLDAATPILETLAGKYGVDPKDIDKLQKAIEDDASYFEDEAQRKGLTVEQLKSMKRMEAENQKLRQVMEQRQKQEGEQKAAQMLEMQSQACKQAYPDFSFESEINSPETGLRFARILQSGTDVKTAYEIIHKDELLSGAIGYAAQVAQKRAMDTIRARGMRPAENGASGTGAAKTVKSDPRNWTKADRAEVRRRVMRGERITLGD